MTSHIPVNFNQNNLKFGQNQSIGKEREEVLGKERMRREGRKERVKKIKETEKGIEM